jgi:uncharacterized protein YbjT (DUF2867 family)
MPNNQNSRKTILVSGATGHQGGATLRHLREHGFPVRALTRDPDRPEARSLIGHGVEVARGDMDDAQSLARALDGAYGAYSVQNWHQGSLESEIRQGIQFADTAKRSDIQHFVYSSVASADQHTGIPHFESKFRVEEHIRETGIPFTIVRPVFFMENWLGMRQVIESGTLQLPLSAATRLQMVAVTDIGAVVALAFERLNKWKGRVFEIAGDELSMEEVAQVFTRAAGREVKYVQIPWDQFQSQAGEETARMFRWFEEVGYHVDIGAVRQEHGKLMTFERWINSSWHSSTRTAG